MDCSLSGSSIHGILQARILEWVTIPFSRGSSCPGIKPRSPVLQADSLPSELPGKLMPLGCGKFQNVFYKNSLRTSLVVQWLRIHLAMQRTQVQSLKGKLTSHMPWSNQAHTSLESMHCNEHPCAATKTLVQTNK